MMCMKACPPGTDDMDTCPWPIEMMQGLPEPVPFDPNEVEDTLVVEDEPQEPPRKPEKGQKHHSTTIETQQQPLAKPAQHQQPQGSLTSKTQQQPPTKPAEHQQPQALSSNTQQQPSPTEITPECVVKSREA